MFRKEESLQAILYILKKMGGTCDIHKCNKILYFSDNEHLSKWGRTITGDSYNRLEYGAVPNNIYFDIFRSVRGEGLFKSEVNYIRNNYFHFINNKDIEALSEPNMDYLSESEVEILDWQIERLKNKSFNETSALSHGYAWSSTAYNKTISVEDILTEAGDRKEFIDFVKENVNAELAAL